uniref:Tyrosine-protein kinase ephrin type A/B receptor-like domain-containing protein n=1 Tax=Tetradesmus obliquus TaxID=3088 RepID=A0A383V866_TETOB|eukprot:jgi/Sobl393_1/9207/SZX60939.1
MRSHTGITITPAHSGLPGLDEDITTADLHAMAALNNSFTSKNKKHGAPQRHRNLSFTRVLPGTPRGLEAVPVLQTLSVSGEPGTPTVVTASVVSPFAQYSQQEQQQQEQEQQHLLPQLQQQQACHKQHVHHAAAHGFNAMKAFAVLAVMLVCSVGVWTGHQAGVLGPMVRRQLVSSGAAGAQGSATGAGLSCPIGSYYGGVNGCRGCGAGLTTLKPGAMKLDDCVAPAGSFKHRPRVGRLCKKGTYTTGFNTAPACTPCPAGKTTPTTGSTSVAACVALTSLVTDPQSGDLNGGSSSSPSPNPSTTGNLPFIEPQLQVLPGASPLPLPSPVDPVAPGSSPAPGSVIDGIKVDPNSSDLDASPVPSPAADAGAGAASPSPAPRKVNLDNLQVVAQPIDLEPLGGRRLLLLRGR